MILILKSKLLETTQLMVRLKLSRLVYSIFNRIFDYRRVFFTLNSMFLYKSIIYERKLHSPLEGFKLVVSVCDFLVGLPYGFQTKCSLSVLTDRLHFGSSTFELANLFGFSVFVLHKDFIVPFINFVYYMYFPFHLILVVFSMFSGLHIVNIIKYFKFFGFVTLLEVSTYLDILVLISMFTLKNCFIGVNTRDLVTFRVRLFNTTVLYNCIYESGILSLNTVFKLRNLGFKTCLIGAGFVLSRFYSRCL